MRVTRYLDILMTISGSGSVLQEDKLNSGNTTQNMSNALPLCTQGRT